MSRYKQYDLSRIHRIPIGSRTVKVQASDLAQPTSDGSLKEFLESLPSILAAQHLKSLVLLMRTAREKKKPLIWGFGGHVIKVGLSPVLLQLMHAGYVTTLATNGSGIIHDFELAHSGSTSEDVQAEIQTGAFGMAEESGRFINEAIHSGAELGLGAGESIGKSMCSQELRFPELSVALNAYRRRIPLTVHLAIGTDTVHGHPEASGAALGATSHTDFKIFTQQVSELSGGGVYLNIGSAVILPEVFLKAVSTIRSSGGVLEDFTTANLDFIQHYRPTENVVRRPVQGTGRGFSFTGHHEIMIPLLAALLLHS